MISNLSKIIRFLFIIPLLAISAIVFGIDKNQNSNSYFEEKTFYFNKEKSNQIDQLSFLESNNGNFVIIESEPEIELELFSSLLNSFFHFFISLNYYFIFENYSKFLNFEIIPLYELFCKWKFHLSLY